MLTQFTTQGDYNYRTQSDPEKPSGKSLTVPDQNYSIRQILEKFTTGQPINGMGTYNEYDYTDYSQDYFNDFQPDTRRMDLTEQKTVIKSAIAEMEKSNKKTSKQYQKDIKSHFNDTQDTSSTEKKPE